MMTNNDILLMADVVSREKSLDKEVIFRALEAALETATRKPYKEDIQARVSINRESGEYDSFRQWEVIADDEELEFPDRQLSLSDAKQRSPDVEIGGVIEEALPAVPFGRIAAQAAKQVIMQKVREAEREQVVNAYSSQVGTMVSGVVKRQERGDVIVDIGGAEAILHKSNTIARETLRPGDRVRAILNDVREISRGPQLVLDRISPVLLIELFKLEVPEAGEGLIEILGAARDPGQRAKIAVRSNDPKIDPVGACVGIRGSRVQSVSNELNGERVDIIKWSEDVAQFAIQSLAPAEVESIVVDEDKQSMDVVVDEIQLSQAIGKGGQNVRLASELTQWELNIMTAKDADDKAENETAETCKWLMEQLDIDETVATILVQEGFHSLEEVFYVPKQELLDIEEFDEDLVDELRSRAEDTLLTRAIAQAEKLQSVAPENSLSQIEILDENTMQLLMSKGIVSRESLAEYAVDELLEEVEISEQLARDLIMAARAPWFENEDAASQ